MKRHVTLTTTVRGASSGCGDRDIFSTTRATGKTDVVKHEIKTSGPPIKTNTEGFLWDSEMKLSRRERMKQLGVVEP